LELSDPIVFKPTMRITTTILALHNVLVILIVDVTLVSNVFVLPVTQTLTRHLAFLITDVLQEQAECV
jgi:hypothetical protein